MKTSRSTKIAAFTLVATAFLSGCGNNEAPAAKGSPQTKDPVVIESTAPDAMTIAENNNNTVTKEEVTNIIFAEGFESPEYYAILKRSAQSAQQEVVQRELFEKKDPSVCNKLSEVNAQKNCKNGFYYQQATQEKKESLCEKIADDSMKKSCTNQVVQQRAVSEKKPELCAKLSDTQQKKECSNMVNFEIARNSGDVKKCDAIADENFKTMCTNEVKMMAEEKSRQAEFEQQQAAAQEAIQESIQAEIVPAPAVEITTQEEAPVPAVEVPAPVTEETAPIIEVAPLTPEVSAPAIEDTPV